MTGTMAKKDQSESSRTDDVGIQFYTNRRVAAALLAFLQSLPADRRPKKKAVLETALTEYLQRNGFWPPPDDAPAPTTKTKRG